MNRERLDFIDLAKGFCIILVVYTHINTYFKIEYELNTALASFRMPLYFILSGLFFKPYENFRSFIRRKINKLLIPFFFFYLIFSVLLPNLLYIIGYEGLRQSDKLGWKSIFNFVFENHFSNSPIWFLLCLFFLNSYFYIVYLLANRYEQKIKMLVLSVCCLTFGICGYLLGRMQINVWMFMDCALTAMPFFCFGYLLNRHSLILYPNKMDKFLPLSIIVCFAIVYFLSKPVDFVDNIFNEETFFSLYICGMSGTLFVLFSSKLIHKLPLISYWGRYSIIILCLHMPVIQVLVPLIKRMYLPGAVIESLVTLLFTMCAFLIIIPFMRKYFPYVTAQKDVLSPN